MIKCFGNQLRLLKGLHHIEPTYRTVSKSSWGGLLKSEAGWPQDQLIEANCALFHIILFCCRTALSGIAEQYTNRELPPYAGSQRYTSKVHVIGPESITKPGLLLLGCPFLV